jgi:hypothetical protein
MKSFAKCVWHSGLEENNLLWYLILVRVFVSDCCCVFI